VRLTVHVRAGAMHAGIGGSHDGALVVRVREPASDGRANDAVVRVVADELGLARRAVRIVAGTRSRRKVVELDGDGDALAEGLARLRARG